MKAKQTHKQNRTPAVASSGLLAVPSRELEIEMLRRAIQRGDMAVMAAHMSLAAVERKQTARRNELATQLAKLPANN